MKRKVNYLLLSFLTICLVSCNSNKESSTIIDNDDSSSDVIVDENDYYGELLGEKYCNLVSLDKVSNDAKSRFDSEFATNDFKADDVRYFELYKNNVVYTENYSITEQDDVKMIFYNNNSARLVNFADGYALTMPTNTTLNADFSLGEYKSKIYNKDFSLTISKEHSNPYGNNMNGWKIYRDEWIIRHLEQDKWYQDNKLQLTRDKKFEDKTIIDGYSICQYDIEILDACDIKKCFYNIAILREENDYINFYLFVMKSTTNQNDVFDNMLQSFNNISQFGVANNSYLYDLPLKESPYWNDKTRQFYQNLCNQNYTGWGFFAGNLNDSDFDECQENLEQAFDYKMDYVSNYMHTSWFQRMQSFPSSKALSYCGDGTDGKPVLQFSYQFTDNNNNLSDTSNMLSPLLYILRGYSEDETDLFSLQNKYKNALKALGGAIAAYEKPVLFRLNNEMNTDWTTYSGIFNLLDPDLFKASWITLYRIFEEKGALANCIFIFNPIATSCPFSSWGMDLNYFPGVDYVQVRGLTYYQNNNYNEAATNSFAYMYSNYYGDMIPYWKNYPWFISEFACGSGGETQGTKYRHSDSQEKWIREMFINLNRRDEFCKRIKGAIWFNRDDLTLDDDGNYISYNSLEINLEVQGAVVEAFKEGLANTKALK